MNTVCKFCGSVVKMEHNSEITVTRGSGQQVLYFVCSDCKNKIFGIDNTEEGK